MIIEGESTTADVKLPESEIEDGLVEEMQEMVDHEAFQNPVKFMPDTHGGLGPQAIVGFSMQLNNRVVPNTIGGDIGCGMTAAKLDGVDVDFDDIDDLRAVNGEVRGRVPMGTGRVNDHGKDFASMYPFAHANVNLKVMFDYLDEGVLGDREFGDHRFDIDYAESLFDKVGISKQYAKNSLGSLGGGNHFIEVAESEEDGSIWIVVHSGSRNLGQKVKNYHQEDATFNRSRTRRWDMDEEVKEYVMSDGSPFWKRIKEDFDGGEIQEMGDRVQSYSPDSGRNTNLDYLEGAEMFDYLKDMVFTQQYATENRYIMLSEVEDTLDGRITEMTNSPHNYIDFRSGMIHKGSTRSLSGDEFVIPMNMESGTLVCRGNGNPEWNYSAPHGAGRLGSRGWAHDQFDSDEVRQRMYENGTYSSNVPTDEVPGAYKPVELIEEQIKPTAEVVDRLVPRMNFKN